jgi:hypothetical protein
MTSINKNVDIDQIKIFIRYSYRDYYTKEYKKLISNIYVNFLKNCKIGIHELFFKNFKFNKLDLIDIINNISNIFSLPNLINNNNNIVLSNSNGLEINYEIKDTDKNEISNIFVKNKNENENENENEKKLASNISLLILGFYLIFMNNFSNVTDISTKILQIQQILIEKKSSLIINNIKVNFKQEYGINIIYKRILGYGNFFFYKDCGSNLVEHKNGFILGILLLFNTHIRSFKLLNKYFSNNDITVLLNFDTYYQFIEYSYNIFIKIPIDQVKLISILTGINNSIIEKYYKKTEINKSSDLIDIINNIFDLIIINKENIYNFTQCEKNVMNVDENKNSSPINNILISLILKDILKSIIYFDKFNATINNFKDHKKNEVFIEFCKNIKNYRHTKKLKMFKRFILSN